MTNSLTLEQRLQVACYHSIGAKHPNWEVDPATGGMVCCLCGNPSPDTVLRICAECGDEFVLKRDDPKWEPKMVTLLNGQLIERTFYCPPCY